MRLPFRPGRGDLADEVPRWTAAAGEGRFEIRREVGYVAGIATYILAGELALGKVLAGELPRPAFPPRLQETAPAAWSRLAPGALYFADVITGDVWPRRSRTPTPSSTSPPGHREAATDGALPPSPG